MYKVNEVSKLSGVSIRMLHHYDEIGVLIPSRKTEKRYRLYSDEDIKRLYQILTLKELDFTLNDIKKILDDKTLDTKEVLKFQKELVLEKRNRLNNIIQSIDEQINDLGGNRNMSKKDFKVFDYENIKKHEERYKDETKKKYGDSDAYSECSKKTESYNKNDWKKISDEANKIYEELAQLMDKAPEDEEVQIVIEKWRNHISKNFYNCTIEIFRGLGIMYIADERFTKNIDKCKTGLAQFLSDGIKVYCDKISR